METPMKKPVAIISSERDNFDKLIKENKALKQKVDALEKENMLLKKSIYDLSVKYTEAAHHQRVRPFVIDFEEPVPVQDSGKEIIDNLDNSSDTLIVAGNNLREKNRERRIFHSKTEFKGHNGAVYAIQFSPCGKMLASGSFDKTVRIWDTISLQKEQACLKGHTLNVSDVCWSNDSTVLLSGAYDQTCKLWDIETNRYTNSFESEGFVQCVMFNPQDNNIFAYGTSRKIFSVVDTRKPDNALNLKGDGMINSLYVCRDGQSVVTGDSLGYVKTWDLRAGSASQSFLNEPTKKPISHVAFSQKSPNDEEEPRYMAVNSYDNVIRIYDRGIEPHKAQPRLIHVLKGYKNKGWPIKSSFFLGREYLYSATQRATQIKDIFNGEELQTDSADSVVYEKDKPLEASLLFATGSADPYSYIFNVGGPENTGELLQRLEGHTDFVYAVDFHPVEPILATCSADYTIRVWAPNSRSKKEKIMTFS
ncbi:13536_t:CDS:10 [Acaulospora morrowiae]|uniref:13536_t:CDS:1 n=1 Tax=Acaulospora morrowiae TaxID=94023 RepID=A0A9N8ZHM7_9GLOM|nr:13536_t:CDS:10 [Acaulospora morrowiae]